MRTPTFSCYARVGKCLGNDRASSQYLSPPTEELQSSTGALVKFPKEIIALTDMLHEQGRDARTLSREHIIRWAADLFMRKVKLECKPRPTPEIVPAKIVQKPEVKPETVAEKPAPASAAPEEIKKPRAVKREERIVEPSNSVTSPLLTGARLKMDIAVPLFSLASSASQLIECHCKHVPAAAQWQENLDRMMTELQTVSLK